MRYTASGESGGAAGARHVVHHARPGHHSTDQPWSCARRHQSASS